MEHIRNIETEGPGDVATASSVEPITANESNAINPSAALAENSSAKQGPPERNQNRNSQNGGGGHYSRNRRQEFDKDDANKRTPKKERSSDRQQPNQSNKRGKFNGEAGAEGANSSEEKKFSNRSRLFVGNLINDVTEKDVRELFEKFGSSPPEVFLDKQKLFAFVRMDTRANAEKAKAAMDGFMHKGRIIRVRFATQSAGICVKNLGQNVSNELLYRAFAPFGDIEKAVVAVDEKGRPCGEGVVYFARKPGAVQAFNKINDSIFFLGSSPRPVIVEMLDHKDLEDGLPEVHISNRPQYKNEISEEPHFAQPGSLEFEFGSKWRKLFDDHHNQVQHLNKMFQQAGEILEKEMEKSVDDFEINKIRQTIAQETLKMRQLEERQMARRGGSANQQQQGGPLGGIVPPPGFTNNIPSAMGSGGHRSSPGPQNFMEQFPVMPQGMMSSGGGNLNFPGVGMGSGLGQNRMQQQFGSPSNFMPTPPNFSPFDQQQQQSHPFLDMNVNQYGQRQNNFDTNKRKNFGGNNNDGGRRNNRNGNDRH